MRKRGPFIGITCRSLDDLPQHHRLYEKAVAAAGGSSTFIPPGTPVEHVLAACDGFIIPGGRDPAPALYKERRVFDLEMEDRRRISFELALLHEIISLRKPVLGICYGMQLLNIFFEGTLYQDIRAQVPGSLNHERKMHSITVTDNPHMKSGEFVVNSRHHEAVKAAGRGLIRFAFSADGLTEAFYLAGYPFLLGVQWHPERMKHTAGAILFRRFVGACRDKQ